MQLLAWIALCAIAAFLFRARPVASLVGVLALWFFVPTVGSYLLTGQRFGPLTFHAATWLTLAILFVQLIQAPRTLVRAVARHNYLFLVILLVLAVAVLTTLTARDGGGMVLFLDQMVAPAVFFLLTLAAGASSPNLVGTFRTALLLFAGVVTAVAAWQWSSQEVLFYESGFLTQFWFNPETQRWMGTFDQPLALSFVLCALMPLLAGVRSLFLAVPMIGLFMTGVVISQSRVGMVVASAGAVYAIASAQHRRPVKAVVLGAIGVGFIYLLASPLAEGILGRVADDTGSTEARNKAYGVFARDWDKYFFAGDGLTASYEVAEYAGLQTSFESSLLMYAVDIGIVFAVLYFGSLLVVVLRNRRLHDVPGLTVAGLVVVLVPQMYSGLATRSVAGILVWAIIAMTIVAAERAQVSVRSASLGARRSVAVAERSRPAGDGDRVGPRPAAASPAGWIGR